MKYNLINLHMKTKLLFAIFCIAVYSNAQITTGELPYGMLIKKNSLVKDIQVHKELKTVTAIQKAQIAQEDLIYDAQPGPERYAFDVPVNYNLENSGTWQKMLDGGRLWRLKVEMKDALSTNAYYDRFWLPEGAKFFVYNEETGQSIGAITSEFIEGSREKPIQFATALIYGENVVFEYYEPPSAKQSAIISVSHIGYGYRFVDNLHQISLRGFGDANSCHIDINSPTGRDWQQYEKHAVARVSVRGPNGSGWCSCALVNNTRNDYTPYVLTADHCLEGLDAVSNNNASQWVFYWEYEHSGNQNLTSEPVLISTTGATLKANNSYTDFALLQLTQDPRNNSLVLPYYLGWERASTVVGGAVGIHHPRGDVKKISQMNQIYSNNYVMPDLGAAPQSHWVAYIYNGYSESGSSGSPLLNSSHKVIGQLTGSQIRDSCGPKSAFYGRFDISWTGNNATDSRRRLKDWLDPRGTNPQSLDGIVYDSNNIHFVFLTGSISRSYDELWFNQFQNVPLFVCPGLFVMNFRSNKANLTSSCSNISSYSFSNLGGGYYRVTGAFDNVYSMSSISFRSGNSGASLSFYVDCDAYSRSLPTPAINLGTEELYKTNEDSSVDEIFKLSGTRVFGVSGAISVYAETDTQVCVYNTSGQAIVKRSVNAGTTRINLPSGLYFVSLENSSHKVFVK